jgi:hypothetical protein
VGTKLPYRRALVKQTRRWPVFAFSSSAMLGLDPHGRRGGRLGWQGGGRMNALPQRSSMEQPLDEAGMKPALFDTLFQGC